MLKDLDIDLSRLPVSKITGKPVIHFAHANGMPSKVYQPIFDILEGYFTVDYIPVLGLDENGEQKYQVDNHWKSLTKQVIKSVENLSKKHKTPIIGLGHSLGALCTLQAMYKKPKLFIQAVLMDPPLIYGIHSFAWHLAKLTSSKAVDKLSPAGISKHRRDVWDSRQQARELLRPKSFFKNFDARCFEGYIQHGLSPVNVNEENKSINYADGDFAEGVKVTLTIPKEIEVAVFKTNPSWYWLKPNKPPKKPVTLLIGDDSKFFHEGFPKKIENRLSIPYKVHAGGHMFPLEHPESVTKLIVNTIVEQSSN